MAEPREQFWRSFLKAVETEPRDAREIRGASGFVHPLLGVGVDEARGRTVIISGDPDARTAALAQADIQSALPSTRVVMARPVAINLRAFAISLIERVGATRITLESLQALKGDHEDNSRVRQFFDETFSANMDAVARPFKFAVLNTLSFWKELVQQVSLLRVEGLGTAGDESTRDGGTKNPAVLLEKLLTFDPVALDRLGGVCAVPLFDFAETDFELFHREATEEVRELLRTHHVFQYFFPPADQIALAAAERERNVSATTVTRQVSLAPDAGHPLARNELVDPGIDVSELLEALGERGLIVEGSSVVEVTPEGRSVRAEVKFRPREGVIEKLSRLLSVKLNINLKDIFKS